MAARDRPDRYSSVAIWFHWTIALLVILNLAVGLLHDSVPALRSMIQFDDRGGLSLRKKSRYSCIELRLFNVK